MPDPSDLRAAAGRGLVLAALWPLAVLAGLAAFVHLRVDADQLDVVRSLRPLDAILALLSLGAVFPAMGARWRALLPKRDAVGVVPISAVAASGQLVGIALPGPVGELAAAALVQRRWGIAAPLALAASLHARVLGLLTGVILAGGLLLTGTGVGVPEGWTLPLLAGGVVVGAMVLTLTGLALFPSRFLRLTPPGWLPNVGARVWGLVTEFLEGASQLGRGVGRPHAEALLWSFVMHGCAGLGVWLLARGLGGDPSLAGVLFTQGAISAGALVLFLLPGQALGWDAAFAAFLVAAGGLDMGTAVATTALCRLVQTLLMAAGPALVGVDLARVDLNADRPPEGGKGLQSPRDEAP